ncbi:pectin lyase [Fusarium phyllophilum]|uniref:Pectin lyase n=1 Tax=Fusarium phyllophilum TaxID=47803 RepID=A0A8H5MRL1_9HYPO|nr:pectin lyase [Fusarium phyllophilum]
MASASAHLGIEEVLIVVGGAYEKPVHFKGINFKHSTWLRPDTYGFEASRPHWWQMPSAIQISAAYNITIKSCAFRELGAGGIVIGNDKNAHLTGVGLDANNIHIDDKYFTQVMGNGITVGDIQTDADHPSQPKMLLSDIHAPNNIFNKNSVLWSSTVPILFTYTEFSSITHNDTYHHPYSGIVWYAYTSLTSENANWFSPYLIPIIS